ncbi:uncharacterized protein M6B38_102365 [Iris pallida]|uniref:Uncharacterized protein n=1 Tax=Iris pallida TaxID=29817 RepID=A0AAX6ISH7_IRIPA|nr:uncharacterized protein M6B38_102365 [Iris pallida]
MRVRVEESNGMVGKEGICPLALLTHPPPTQLHAMPPSSSPFCQSREYFDHKMGTGVGVDVGVGVGVGRGSCNLSCTWWSSGLSSSGPVRGGLISLVMKVRVIMKSTSTAASSAAPTNMPSLTT